MNFENEVCSYTNSQTEVVEGFDCYEADIYCPKGYYITDFEGCKKCPPVNNEVDLEED